MKKRLLIILLIVITIFSLMIVPSYAVEKENVSLDLSVTSGMTYNYGEGTMTFHINISSTGTPSGQIELVTVGKKSKTIAKVDIAGNSIDYTCDVKGTAFVGGFNGIQAKYKGDANYNSASSNSVNVQINPAQLTITFKKTVETYTGDVVVPEIEVEGLLEGDDASIVTMSFMDNNLKKVKEMIDADTYTITLGTKDSRYTIPFSNCTVMFTIERGVCPFVEYYMGKDGEDAKTKTDGLNPLELSYGEANRELYVFVPNGAGKYSVNLSNETGSTTIVEKTNDNPVKIELPKNAGEYQLVFSFDEGVGYLAGDFILPVNVLKLPINVDIKKSDKKGYEATIDGILPDDYVLPVIKYYDESGKEYDKVPQKKGTYVAKVVLEGVNGSDYTFSEDSTYELEYVVEKTNVTIYIIIAVCVLVILAVVLFLLKKGKKAKK